MYMLAKGKIKPKPKAVEGLGKIVSRSYFGFNLVLSKMYMLAQRKIKPKPKTVEGLGIIS